MHSLAGVASASASLRILVLHQHYWPEIAATAQILSDLCEDLAALGHEVSVVCGQPSYRVAHGAEPLPTRERHRNVDILRVASYTPTERTIPKRLIHYGSYFATSLATALTNARPDVCFVMSTPPLLLGVTGTLVRFLRGVPFVYSVQDLYPDIAVHLGVLRHKSPAEQIVGHIARVCYRSASAIVTLSHGMGTQLVAKGVRPDAVHVIPNWADTSAITTRSRDNDFARAHGLCDTFVVQYSGNLGMSQGLESVIEAAERLQTLPITFALVGDGNARASLEAAVQARNLSNVRFLPPQPRERLADLLASCDVGIVPMRRGVGNDLVPSKLYGIMAAGRPVLASVEPESEVARVVSEHACGWVVAPESGSALADGVLASFRSSAEQRAHMGQRGRLACAQRYSRGALTQRYERVIREAAAGNRHALAVDHA